MGASVVQGSLLGTGVGASTAASTANAKGLQDQFLQLLAAQMKYQDPLSPMTNTDFIAQAGQFATVEAVNSMKDTQQKMMAASLVGKTVYYEGEGVECSGTVWGVKLSDGVALLVNEEEVSLDSIIAVR